MKFIVSFLLFGFLLSASVQAQANCPDYKMVSPPLEHQIQESGDWCSAASVRVVMSHFGTPKTQCQLMADAVGMPCCVNQTGCHPSPTIWPHDIFNKINYTYTPLYSKTMPPTGPPSWADILREICINNRALVSIVAPLNSTNLHAVVIEGYRVEPDTTKKVNVYDPQEDMVDDPTFECWYSSCKENDTDYIQIVPAADSGAPMPPMGLQVR
jgi:hypothetical protein